ncbi:MAG: CsgG/HfaB family protein [Treponema sp.]|jgi:hypothetical protein|nr:CsgG/HfaB family protein [Treponema sp.]
MKNKHFSLLIVLCSLLIVFYACATTPTASDDLDVAIRDTSDYLNDNIPTGNKIVILNIQSDYTGLSEYIIDELIANAVNDKVFSVVDRAQLDQIRMELNFQLSGEVDDKSALEIGKFLGAQTIVSGAISPLADRHRLRIRALNVETAVVQGQYNRNINPSKTITALLKDGKSSSPHGSNTASYGTASSKQGITATTNDTGSNSQTTQLQGSQAQQLTGMKNGTYTLWPRPRATQAGLPINFYFAQIVASNDYIVFFFARNAQGDFSNGHNGFWEFSHFTLQDLDTPSRFYKPVQSNHSGNGMGTIWTMSFKRFTATRFQITANGAYPYGPEPIVWEEINIGEPDK